MTAEHELQQLYKLAGRVVDTFNVGNVETTLVIEESMESLDDILKSASQHVKESFNLA
jgi:hypothetical protein